MPDDSTGFLAAVKAIEERTKKKEPKPKEKAPEAELEDLLCVHGEWPETCWFCPEERGPTE